MPNHMIDQQMQLKVVRKVCRAESKETVHKSMQSKTVRKSIHVLLLGMFLETCMCCFKGNIKYVQWKAFPRSQTKQIKS